MSVAIVAEPDSGERARCVSILASQTSLGALGAGNWQELQQVLESGCDVGLIVYHPPLAGAPDNALEELLARARRLAIVSQDASSSVPEGACQLCQPIQQETLVLLARSATGGSGQHPTFQPVDLIQMLCMSRESQVLVLSHDGQDVGVIEIQGGAVWTAYDSLGVGEGAFARLLHPQMRARTGSRLAFAKERTIFASHEKLILDSLRMLDEGKVSVPPPLSTSALQPLSARTPSREAVVAELATQARRYLTGRNYNDAARMLLRLAELDPKSPLVLANLEHLHSLGYPND